MSTDKKMQKTSADWSNYWQGRVAVEAGAALVGVGVETDQEIAGFWKERLIPFLREARCLDLACGAGSVLRHLDELGFTDLTGLDISGEAISHLTTAFPHIKGVVASADETTLEAGSFDVVVSQFGFEYANAAKAASEVARLLAPGGTFLALAHIKDGAIEAEVAGHLSSSQAILDTNFIPLAKRIFEAEMSGESDQAFDKAAQDFGAAQDKLGTLVRQKVGLANHLYQGTQQLYQKRKAYLLDDVYGWLDGMQGEIEAYVGRMASMQSAALSDDDVQNIASVFESAGMVLFQDVFTVTTASGQQDKIGRILTAVKPA